MSCPQPSARLTDPVPRPKFEPNDTWPTWSDKLLGWGLEVEKLRTEYVIWINDQCKKKKAVADGER